MEVVFANFKIMLIHEVKRHLKLNSADQMTSTHKKEKIYRLPSLKKCLHLFSNRNDKGLTTNRIHEHFIKQ